MADMEKKRNNGMVLDDGWLRDMYKAGLDGLQASDELVKTTLENCRAELGKAGKSNKVRKNISLRRAVLMFGTPIAACLLVLALILNFNGLISMKNTTEGAVPQDSAAAESAPEKSAAIAKVGGNQSQYALRYDQENASETDKQSTNEKTAVMDVQISFAESIKAPNSLNSFEIGDIRSKTDENVPSDAALAVAEAYNTANGTKYTLYENKTVTVYTLKSGGVNVQEIRKAENFDEIIGKQQYHLLPLRDENQKLTMMLPVVESAVSYSDYSNAPADIVYTNKGRTWLSSAYWGIKTEQLNAEFLLNREEHLRIVKETFGTESINDYKIIDIQNGNDFVIVIKADGAEYAIPCFKTVYSDAVENYKAYHSKDVLKSLVDSLETK